MAMASPMASPYSYFTDANGAPLAGGLVYTYTAGTATPQNSYTDSTGGTPAANPVVLDSAGKAAIWLSGSYKIVVKDSVGNTISTTDNITTVSSTITSAVDTAFTFSNGSDATKKLAFSLSGITTGTTRTATWPDKNGTVAMTSDVGGRVLLQTQTASSSVIIDFTTGIDSTYKRYQIETTDLLLASGASVYLLVSINAGGAWITTSSYAYHVGNGTAGAGTYGGVAGTGIAQLNITGPLAPGTASTDGYNITIDIANPANAATYTQFSINGSAVNASSGNIVSSIKGGGCYAVAAAVNGIRILANSGNIASGTLKLYGVP